MDLGHLCALGFLFHCPLTGRFPEGGSCRSGNECGQEEQQVCQEILECEPKPTEIHPHPKLLHDLRREWTIQRESPELKHIGHEVDVAPEAHRVERHSRYDYERPAPGDVPVAEQRCGHEQPLHKGVDGDDEEAEAAPEGGMDKGE